MAEATRLGFPGSLEDTEPEPTSCVERSEDEGRVAATLVIARGGDGGCCASSLCLQSLPAKERTASGGIYRTQCTMAECESS